MTDSSSVTKRYTPPNQRNRSLNRRKSGDRLDRSNNDGDKNQFSTQRNVPAPGSQLIALEGCSRSEAFHHMRKCWTAALNLFNDPTSDLSERPIMHLGSDASAWGQARLPHQIMNAGNASPKMDFIRELRQAIQNAKVGSQN